MTAIKNFVLAIILFLILFILIRILGIASATTIVVILSLSSLVFILPLFSNIGGGMSSRGRGITKSGAFSFFAAVVLFLLLFSAVNAVVNNYEEGDIPGYNRKVWNEGATSLKGDIVAASSEEFALEYQKNATKMAGIAAWARTDIKESIIPFMSSEDRDLTVYKNTLLDLEGREPTFEYNMLVSGKGLVIFIFEDGRGIYGTSTKAYPINAHHGDPVGFVVRCEPSFVLITKDSDKDKKGYSGGVSMNNRPVLRYIRFVPDSGEEMIVKVWGI